MRRRRPLSHGDMGRITRGTRPYAALAHALRADESEFAAFARRLDLRRRLWLGRRRSGRGLWRGFGLRLWLRHLSVCRSHRPRRHHLVALAIAVRVHDTKIVLGMLIEILGSDAVS